MQEKGVPVFAIRQTFQALDGGGVMAIFHFPVSIVSRGKGQSAVAKAAYNAREKLENEKTGELHDYTHAEGLAFSGIFASKDAPEWVQDREKLWSEVERVENRVNSQLARSIEIGLPHELTEEQRRQLVTDFVRENFVRKGMIADVAIHRPDRDGDERNHHAHILLTMREIGPDGFGAKRREWNSKEQLETWRENWARTANRYLERHGHEARIDHRSLEAQGIDREATVHLGPMATQKERAGEPSERGDINRDIEARNRERERLQIEARAVGRELTEAEQARPQEPAPLTGRDVERLRRAGYDVLREAGKTEDHRREVAAKREAANEANRAKIHKAAENAADGLDFMIRLNDDGLQLATSQRGQFVAVAKNGFEHSLKGMPNQSEILAEIHARQSEGLLIPTAAQVREDLHHVREDEAEKQRRDVEKRASHRGATLYDQGGMVSQQQDALIHHADHLKAIHQADRKEEREAKERQQREHEGKERAEQTKREKDSFAAREDHGQQKVSDRAARSEQTDRKQRTTQSLAEKLYGKSFQPSRIERDDNERERER